jgi:hypothetical protein
MIEFEFERGKNFSALFAICNFFISALMGILNLFTSGFYNDDPSIPIISGYFQDISRWRGSCGCFAPVGNGVFRRIIKHKPRREHYEQTSHALYPGGEGFDFAPVLG